MTHIPYLQTNCFTILRILGSPDSRLVHDASLCFLCGWIQKPLLFKRMFLFPCSLFDIGPCVKCGMSGPRRLWQWQCRAPLAFLIAGTLCILEHRAGNEPSRTITERFLKLPVPYDLCQHPNLNVKALGAFNLEKALVRSDYETQTSQRLVSSSSAHVLRCQRKCYLQSNSVPKTPLPLSLSSASLGVVTLLQYHH